MDYTCDIDRTILRIITVTGATRCTSGAAVGLPLHHGRRPEDFYVTACTAQRLLLSMPHVLTIIVLLGMALCVHILKPACCYECCPLNFCL